MRIADALAQMGRVASRLIADQRGDTATQYAILCALIVLVIVGAIQGTGGGVAAGWNNVANKVTAVMP
jgi:Flp pilus assembly pilin Flp